MPSFRKFLRDLNKAIKEVPKEAKKLQTKIALDGLGRIVLKTPVKLGRARGNWQVGINESPQGFEENTFDKSGGRTIRVGGQIIKNAPAYSKIHITNNVPYIEALEDGHSQRSRDMLKLTFQELLLIYK